MIASLVFEKNKTDFEKVKKVLARRYTDCSIRDTIENIVKIELHIEYYLNPVKLKEEIPEIYGMKIINKNKYDEKSEIIDLRKYLLED